MSGRSAPTLALALLLAAPLAARAQGPGLDVRAAAGGSAYSEGDLHLLLRGSAGLRSGPWRVFAEYTRSSEGDAHHDDAISAGVALAFRRGGRATPYAVVAAGATRPVNDVDDADEDAVDETGDWSGAFQAGLGVEIGLGGRTRLALEARAGNDPWFEGTAGIAFATR